MNKPNILLLFLMVTTGVFAGCGHPLLIQGPDNSVNDQDCAGRCVLLEWDPSPDADVTGYRIYVGFSSGSYLENVDVGNVTSYTVRNLTPGQTYFFAATAYNSAGMESVFSNEVVMDLMSFLFGNTRVAGSVSPNRCTTWTRRPEFELRSFKN
ncbi:MAG: hypothetical protein A2X94_03475 [Bdellovibrionales bacterium GWB1_55_8]|nr:MAG: hypothetical protein A2X94_03475 [Bdellovibrionales bacterium GWB1_55_8]